MNTEPFAAQLRALVGRRQIQDAADYASVNRRTFSQWIIGRRVPCAFVRCTVLARLKTLPKRQPKNKHSTTHAE